MSQARPQSSGDGFDVRSLATDYGDGYRIPPHSHPWGQLIFATRGVMQVTADNAVWVIPPTRALWAPADVRHAIRMKGGVDMRTLYISTDLSPDLPVGVRVIEVQPLLREVILHVLGLGMLHPDNASHARLSGLLVELIAQARPLDLWLPLPHDPRGLAMAQQLQVRPEAAPGLAEAAAESGASLRTLQRLFQAQTGLSLEAWRQKSRLVQSAADLIAGASVTVAGLDAGYDSPSAYIAAFKRQFGVTPGRFGQASA